jgi:hypothetical protein
MTTTWTEKSKSSLNETKTVTVINNSSYTVTNTVDGISVNILSGATNVFTYTSASFNYVYDTQLGYDVTIPLTNTATYVYTIIDDVGIPGAVVASGTSTPLTWLSTTKNSSTWSNQIKN